MQRWAENVVWQHFSGMRFYEPRLPCDATQIGRFRYSDWRGRRGRTAQGHHRHGRHLQGHRAAEFERLIVDTTVQEKAIAHPVDSRLLEIARHKVVIAAKRAGIALKQTFVREGKGLAAQGRRLRPCQAVQATQRRPSSASAPSSASCCARWGADQADASSAGRGADRLHDLMQRAERIPPSNPKTRTSCMRMHAPEVECIGKGKARKPYEFGVKVSVAVTHRQGLMVGHAAYRQPYDGHTLAEQLEQVTILTEDGPQPQAGGRRSGLQRVDAHNPGVEIIHRGKFKSLTSAHRRWLKEKASGRACDRALETRQRHGSVLAQRDPWAMRCTRCCAQPATTSAGCCGRSCVWASRAFCALLARLWIWAAALAMATQARRTRCGSLGWMLRTTLLNYFR